MTSIGLHKNIHRDVNMIIVEHRFIAEFMWQTNFLVKNLFSKSWRILPRYQHYVKCTTIQYDILHYLFLTWYYLQYTFFNACTICYRFISWYIHIVHTHIVQNIVNIWLVAFVPYTIIKRLIILVSCYNIIFFIVLYITYHGVFICVIRCKFCPHVYHLLWTKGKEDRQRWERERERERDREKKRVRKRVFEQSL